MIKIVTLMVALSFLGRVKQSSKKYSRPVNSTIEKMALLPLLKHIMLGCANHSCSRRVQDLKLLLSWYHGRKVDYTLSSLEAELSTCCTVF